MAGHTLLAQADEMAPEMDHAIETKPDEAQSPGLTASMKRLFMFAVVAACVLLAGAAYLSSPGGLRAVNAEATANLAEADTGKQTVEANLAKNDLVNSGITKQSVEINVGIAIYACFGYFSKRDDYSDYNDKAFYVTRLWSQCDTFVRKWLDRGQGNRLLKQFEEHKSEFIASANATKTQMIARSNRKQTQKHPRVHSSANPKADAEASQTQDDCPKQPKIPQIPQCSSASDCKTKCYYCAGGNGPQPCTTCQQVQCNKGKEAPSSNRNSMAVGSSVGYVKGAKYCSCNND